MEAIIWLGLVVVLLLTEALTMGLTTIWFAGGALLAFIVALFNGPLPLQVGVFIVVSMVMLIFTRPAATRFMNKKIEKTNVDSMIGKTGVVTEVIHNLQGTGRVAVNGIDWTARTKDENLVLEKDTVVKILKVDGVKLIVEQKTED